MNKFHDKLRRAHQTEIRELQDIYNRRGTMVVYYQYADIPQMKVVLYISDGLVNDIMLEDDKGKLPVRQNPIWGGNPSNAHPVKVFFMLHDMLASLFGLSEWFETITTPLD